MDEAVKDTFKQVEESVNFSSKLDQLDLIIRDEANKCKDKELAWRPSNKALDNQAAHDKAAVETATKKLETEVLLPLQEEVAELQKRVSQLSDEIAGNSVKIKENAASLEIGSAHC